MTDPDTFYWPPPDPPRDTDDIETWSADRLAEAFVDGYDRREGDEGDPDHDRWMAIFGEVERRMEILDADDAWQLVLALVGRVRTDAQCYFVAAGPVEDSFVRFGEVWIERIEARARTDAMFRKVLGGVWESRIEYHTYRRILAAAGHSLPSHEGADDP
jgi:hypothetical protein